MKKQYILGIAGVAILFILIIAVISTSNKTYYNGISITFEKDTPIQAVQAIIDRYSDSADEIYNDFPRQVLLIFSHKSERKLKEISFQIMKEEYVFIAEPVIVVEP